MTLVTGTNAVMEAGLRVIFWAATHRDALRFQRSEECSLLVWLWVENSIEFQAGRCRAIPEVFQWVEIAFNQLVVGQPRPESLAVTQVLEEPVAETPVAEAAPLPMAADAGHVSATQACLTPDEEQAVGTPAARATAFHASAGVEDGQDSQVVQRDRADVGDIPGGDIAGSTGEERTNVRQIIEEHGKTLDDWSKLTDVMKRNMVWYAMFRSGLSCAAIRNDWNARFRSPPLQGGRTGASTVRTGVKRATKWLNEEKS